MALNIFRGISSHLGRTMPQPNNKEVADVRYNPKNRGQFGFLGNGELPYHADLGDMIGFMCLRNAQSGGIRKIASSIAIYYEMMRLRPDLVNVLEQPFKMMIRQPHPGHGGNSTELPLFNWTEQKLSVSAYLVHIKRAQKQSGVAPLSLQQKEALQLFNEIAESLSFEINVVPGDIEFYNNHVVLHSRTAFSHNDNPLLIRHFLRIWLTRKSFRPLPREHPIHFRER